MSKVKVQCRKCFGTGLVKNRFAGIDSAFICNVCDGKGYEMAKPFVQKEILMGVKRVFKQSFGIDHQSEDKICGEGQTVRFSQYGCSYEEWRAGVEPKFVEDLYCPYVAASNGIGEQPCCRCREGLPDSFCLPEKCKFYSDKEKCWVAFHQQNK